MEKKKEAIRRDGNFDTGVAKTRGLVLTHRYCGLADALAPSLDLALDAGPVAQAGLEERLEEVVDVILVQPELRVVADEGEPNRHGRPRRQVDAQQEVDGGRQPGKQAPYARVLEHDAHRLKTVHCVVGRATHTCRCEVVEFLEQVTRRRTMEGIVAGLCILIEAPNQTLTMIAHSLEKRPPADRIDGAGCNGETQWRTGRRCRTLPLVLGVARGRGQSGATAFFFSCLTDLTAQQMAVAS